MIQNQRFYLASVTRDFGDLLKNVENFMILLKIKLNLRAKSGRNSFLEKKKKKHVFLESRIETATFCSEFHKFYSSDGFCYP